MHAQLEDLYSLKLPLGRNLAGAVWQAETLKGGKPAAVAVLDLEDLSDADVRKRAATRFRRDMGLLRRVNHPHVVRILNVGRTRAGRPFAAMEHVDGESLHDWLESPQTGSDRIRVASALLDGLEAAHKAGVAHGDLEPGNVLMNNGLPKLIGFGLNRTLARQSHPEWREESGLAKTIAFRAPEEAQGMGGHSADVYAAGIMLHLICSDELPGYEGSTLREKASRLPAGLIGVIERALMEDPAERHPSMGAMRKAWLDAATVAKDAIEAAESGFRTESERPARTLSAPPSVGVALAPEYEEEEDDEDEVATGRASLMPVGVALADDDEDDDLTKLPPERVNVLDSAPPPLEAREIAERFSDPPPDDDMRISLSDALGDPPPDPEMRISLSDAMDVNPAPAPPRPAPRRPSPAEVRPATPVPPKEGGSNTIWLVAGAVLLIGGAVWFSQRSSPPDEPIEVAGDPQVEPETSPREVAPPEEDPVAEAPPEESGNGEAENPPTEPVFVALRLHGLPAGAQARVDGVATTIDGDSISFPGDGEEHTIVVTAEGYETWERSLATATPLDLLVVSEAIAPPPTPMAPPGMNPLATTTTPMTTPMRTTPMRTSPVMRPTMRTTMGTTMRPGLARDPGF